jgi:hypothetical protein
MHNKPYIIYIYNMMHGLKCMHAGGIGRVNKDGVDYYHRLINYLLANRT